MDHTWCRLPYFTDKSMLIKTFLKSRHKAILVTAPQGFLKTTNLKMIASFLNPVPADSKVSHTPTTWFHNTDIMHCYRSVNEHLGKHPVIYFSFDQRQAYSMRYMVTVFRKCYSRYKFLLDSGKLTQADKAVFRIYLNYDHRSLGGSEVRMVDALKTLCELLHKHYEKQVFVFIDNYDSPLLEAIAKSRPIFNFRMFVVKMVWGVCGTKSVRKVLLTGITNIERITGAEVVEYKFLHDHPFSKYFGFTEEDLSKVANKCSAEVLHEMQSRHYSTVANTNMYSPEWILHYLNYSPIENELWYEDIFVKDVFREPRIRKKLQTLLDGRDVKFSIYRYESDKDALMLNKLLNGTPDELEETDINMLLSLLLDFGMLTVFEGSNSIKFSCWTSNQKMKLVLNTTSRVVKSLRNIL